MIPPVPLAHAHAEGHPEFALPPLPTGAYPDPRFNHAHRRRPADEAVPPRLVACDMDGTLLDRTAARVSPRNAEALVRVAEAGSRVVIATGRPIWWLDPVIQAGFTGTAVCMNGAIVYDIEAGRVVAASPLSPQVMSSFVTGLTAHAGEVALAVERIGTTIDSCWAEEHYDHPWEFGLFHRADRQSVLADPAAKMLVRGGTDSAALAEAAMATQAGRRPEVAITWSTTEGLLEVSAAGVHKGSTLAHLATQWGIDASEVIAFGDMRNDVEMLSWAGRAFAMAGGHPETHAVATGVAPDHDEDGVAQILERWF